MAVLQILQCFFMVFDGAFQLLDILSPPLAEGRLRLPVPLLALLRGRVNLTRLGQSYF